MAKVRVKIGDNEAEVDSRDFYVDNQTIGQVIDEVSKHLLSSSAIVYGDSEGSAWGVTEKPESGLGSLDDAEVHEPEFSGPAQISSREVESKLGMLEKNSFFDVPRTVSETVGQLHEYGWIASPLDVSKTLTKMALRRELVRDSQNNRNYYMITDSPLAS